MKLFSQSHSGNPAVDLNRLMARFQTALDEEAFEQLVSALLRPAMAVAWRLLRDRALAEDAVQEAFLRVVRNRAAYDPHRPFSAWFYGILHNICIDVIRARQHYPQSLAEVAGGADAVPETPRPDSGDAGELLAMLPEGERDVLELRMIHELSFSDIASAMGISEEAAKKRGQRGLQRLRQRLAAADQPAGGSPAKPRLHPCPQTTPSPV